MQTNSTIPEPEGMKSEAAITEQDLPASVVQAIKQGRKVVAIKMLREETGLGMANAKVLVDRASARINPRPPRQVHMRDYNPVNGRLLGMAALLIAVFAVYRFYFA